MGLRVSVVAMSASLLVVGCSSGSRSSQTTATSDGSAAGIAVTLTGSGCEPRSFQAPVGMSRFSVVNHGPADGSFAVFAGDRALGRVVGVPRGASTSFDLDLVRGAYRTACQAGSSAGGGTLLVGAAHDSPSLGQPADLLAATTAYRAYLHGQTAQLLVAVGTLRDDLSTGDLEGARASYLTARLIYSRVKVAARNFGNAQLPGVSDLDRSIDPAPNGATSGLPRIAAGLWAGSTLGLTDVAAALTADVDRFDTRLASVDLDAVSVANGTADQLGDLVNDEVAGQAEPADHLDLVDVQGVVDGSIGALSALRAALARRNPTLEATVTARLATVEQLLTSLRGAAGYPETSAVSPATRRQLASALDASADAFSLVGVVLAQPVDR